jgi:hypothetical protein
VKIDTRLNQLASRLGSLFDWAITIARATLPKPLRELGSRPSAQLLKLDADGELVDVGALYKSVLGEPQIRPAKADTSSGKAIVRLAASAQYRRRLTLSREAFRRGRTALELRLNELSPLPPGDAVFDLRVLSSPASDGVDVEVAIARRSQVEELAKMLGGTGKRWAIVGDIEDNGAVRFQFEKNEIGFDSRKTWSFIRPLLLLAAVLFACFAWVDRSARELDGLQTRQAELVVSARQLRDVSGLITTADRARLAEDGAPYMTHVMQAIQVSVDAGDLGFDIAEISMSRPDQLTIWGFETDADGNPVRVETISRIDAVQ